MTGIVEYHAKHFAGIDKLWREVFPNDAPRNHAEHSIPSKLALEDGLFWVAEDASGTVVGSIMAGWDGHRGWLYTVAVHPSCQRSGIGGKLVDRAVEALRSRGCRKVNLQIRAGNEAVTAFYRDLGFIVEERTSMGREI